MQSFAHDASWQLISGLSATVAQSKAHFLWFSCAICNFRWWRRKGLPDLSLECLPLQVIFCSSQKVNQYLAVTGCRQIAKSQQAKQASCACKETSEVREVPSFVNCICWFQSCQENQSLLGVVWISNPADTLLSDIIEPEEVERRHQPHKAFYRRAEHVKVALREFHFFWDQCFDHSRFCIQVSGINR